MKRNILLLIVIVLHLFIWVNSILPGEVSSQQSGVVADVLYPPFANHFSFSSFVNMVRKAAHFTEFLILGFFLNFLYESIEFKHYFLITLAHLVIVALIDEFIQIFVPGRGAEITDVLIDTGGAIVGILGSLIFAKLFLRKTVE